VVDPQVERDDAVGDKLVRDERKRRPAATDLDGRPVTGLELGKFAESVAAPER
jgi:hypothetical protein